MTEIKRILLLVVFPLLLFLFQNCSKGGGTRLDSRGISSEVSQLSSVSPTQPPFSFLVKAPLLRNPNNERHYPADWSSAEASSKSFYINDTGKSIVLKRFVAKVDSHPFTVGEADLDIGLYLLPQLTQTQPQLHNLIHQVKTTNGIEVISNAQHKSKNSPQWPLSTWEVSFPGQGLLIPPQGIVFCNSQGGAESVIGQQLSRFTCEMFFEEADAHHPEPAVQSIRAPYIDQFFVNTHSSWFSRHVNPTNTSLKILDVFPYISTQGETTEICLWIGESKYCDQKTFDQENSYHSQILFQPFSLNLPPGQSIGAHCTSSSGEKKICAFFFMVGVPVESGKFKPLPVNSTIMHDSKDRFCSNSFQKHYPLSEPEVEKDRKLCRQTLQNFSF